MMNPRDRATPNQCKYLWAFEVRFSGTGEPIKWFDLNRDGKINKGWCSDLIGMCKKWEENPKDTLIMEKISKKIWEHNPKFYFKDGADPAASPGNTPEVTEIIKEVIAEVTLSGDMTFAECVVALSPVIGNDNCDVLKNLWNDRPVPDIEVVEVSGDYYKPEIFDTCRTVLKTKKNLLVYGPAGCGKSRLGRELAESLGLEYFPFSVGGGMRYAQVFGGTQMKVDADGNQFTEFTPSNLLEAIKRPALINLDEIFGLDPEVSLGLNSLLESNDRAIMTPAGLIECHEDCVFMATANTNGRTIDRQYTGALRADASLRDRFVKKHMDYSEAVESDLLDKCAVSDSREFLREQLIVLRREVSQCNIIFDPSTRRLISAIELVNEGIDKHEAFEMAFLEDLSQAERAKIGL